MRGRVRSGRCLWGLRRVAQQARREDAPTESRPTMRWSDACCGKCIPGSPQPADAGQGRSSAWRAARRVELSITPPNLTFQRPEWAILGELRNLVAGSLVAAALTWGWPRACSGADADPSVQQIMKLPERSSRSGPADDQSSAAGPPAKLQGTLRASRLYAREGTSAWRARTRACGTARSWFDQETPGCSRAKAQLGIGTVRRNEGSSARDGGTVTTAPRRLTFRGHCGDSRARWWRILTAVPSPSPTRAISGRRGTARTVLRLRRPGPLWPGAVSRVAELLEHRGGLAADCAARASLQARNCTPLPDGDRRQELPPSGDWGSGANPNATWALRFGVNDPGSWTTVRLAGAVAAAEDDWTRASRSGPVR